MCDVANTCTLAPNSTFKMMFGILFLTPNPTNEDCLQFFFFCKFEVAVLPVKHFHKYIAIIGSYK